MNNPYIVGYTRDDEKIITLFSSLSFIYDNDNKCIMYFGAQSGDNIKRLESIDGSIIEISSLKCKSYEEVLVQMDMHNILHDMEIPGEICTTDIKINNKINNSLKKKVKELTEENRQLKLKLKQLKKIL